MGGAKVGQPKRGRGRPRKVKASVEQIAKRTTPATRAQRTRSAPKRFADGADGADDDFVIGDEGMEAASDKGEGGIDDDNFVLVGATKSQPATKAPAAKTPVAKAPASKAIANQGVTGKKAKSQEPIVLSEDDADAEFINDNGIASEEAIKKTSKAVKDLLGNEGK